MSSTEGQESSSTTQPHATTTQPHPTGFVYGTVCRINFWLKMTTALGITQIVIGLSCMVFYCVAYFTDRSADHFIRYVGVGLVTGSVILGAGILGMISSKKKTKCTIMSFLVMSSMSAMFALFPMVLGIVGATSSMLDEESLLMPICQLVFSTVEIVVATWSIGVCCQAMCCPNTTFGHVATRLPTGMGFTQFISGGDGQHVVLFTNSPATQSTLMYNINGTHPPYVIQHGIPTIQLTTQPGISCAVGQNGLTQPLPPQYEARRDNNHACPAPQADIVVDLATAAGHSDEDQTEDDKLLTDAGEEEGQGKVKAMPQIVIDAVDGYEVEDEEAHLLN